MEEDDEVNKGPSDEYLAWLNHPLTQELLRWAKNQQAGCEKFMVSHASRASDIEELCKVRFYAGGHKLSEAFIARMERGK